MSSGRAIHLLRASRSLLRLRVPPAAATSAVRKNLIPPPSIQFSTVRFCAPFSTSSLRYSDEKAATNPITEDPPLPDPTSDAQDHQSSPDNDGSHYEQHETDNHRSLILEEALKLVPEHGWTGYVLSEGARALGMSSTVGEGEEEEEGGEMFPRGPAELVDYFEQKCNQSLNGYMEILANEDQLEGSKLIKAAVKYRLEMLVPYIDKWPQAMAVKALPPNIPSALETLALMVDDIWYMAGDKSVDINWYTKRALLASLYTSTELYMVQDKSHDFVDTWDFLETRINDVKDLGKIYDDIGKLAKGALQFVWAGVSTARNMSGWNQWSDKQQQNR